MDHKIDKRITSIVQKVEAGKDQPTAPLTREVMTERIEAAFESIRQGRSLTTEEVIANLGLDGK